MSVAARVVTAATGLCGLVGVGPVWGASGTRTRSFAYDTATGLLTQEVVEPNTQSLRLETDYVYDTFGNKTSATVSGVDIVTRGRRPPRWRDLRCRPVPMQPRPR